MVAKKTAVQQSASGSTGASGGPAKNVGGKKSTQGARPSGRPRP